MDTLLLNNIMPTLARRIGAPIVGEWGIQPDSYMNVTSPNEREEVMNYGFVISLSDRPDGRTWRRYIGAVIHHEVSNPETLEVIAEGGDILDQKLACLLDAIGVDCLCVTSAPDRHNLFIRECPYGELDDEFLHLSLRGNCLTDNYGRFLHSHYITLTIGA